jgi:hypothetical protein
VTINEPISAVNAALTLSQLSGRGRSTPRLQRVIEPACLGLGACGPDCQPS